jgi:hypothetical protein
MRCALKASSTPHSRGAIGGRINTIPAPVASNKPIEDEDDDEYENDVPHEWRWIIVATVSV